MARLRRRVFEDGVRVGWWGGPDERPRCLKTDKVQIPDAATAEAKAAKIRARDWHAQPGRPMQAYKCPSCGFYHVGHRRMGRTEA